MHYYPFNLKDYLVQTAHLPPMADLAYRRLLDLYYLEERPIPNKPKWVANRIRLHAETAIIGFVLREFFHLEGVGEQGFWRHPIADEQIAKYKKKVDIAQKNGARHQSGTDRKPKSVAGGFVPNNQEPITNNQQPYPPIPPEGSEQFAKFWATYPKKQKRPDAAKAFAKALGMYPKGTTPRCTFDELMLGLSVHLSCEQWVKDRGEFVPLPSTWLRAESWNDRPLQAIPGGGAQVVRLNRAQQIERDNHDAVERVTARDQDQERTIDAS